MNRQRRVDSEKRGRPALLCSPPTVMLRKLSHRFRDSVPNRGHHLLGVSRMMTTAQRRRIHDNPFGANEGTRVVRHRVCRLPITSASSPSAFSGIIHFKPMGWSRQYTLGSRRCSHGVKTSSCLQGARYELLTTHLAFRQSVQSLSDPSQPTQKHLDVVRLRATNGFGQLYSTAVVS